MNVERLVLTEDQSAHIRAGGSLFLVVSPGSYPETTGRMVLTLIPCTRDTAAAACEVALGKSRAVKKSTATT